MDRPQRRGTAQISVPRLPKTPPKFVKRGESGREELKRQLGNALDGVIRR